MRAVLLDAMGTLVTLEPPVARLRAALAAHAEPPTEAEAAAAIGAEIAHYRHNIERGGDPAGLAALRRQCASVLRAALPERFHAVALEDMIGVLLDSLRFAPYPDAVPALRELRGRGIHIAVVSNWDLSLHEMLAATGLDALVDVAVASAVLGRAKPDPAPFAAALEALGTAPSDALHAGDDVVADVEGARAAGVAAVLIDRAGTAGPPPAGVPTLPTLAGLAELCG